MSQPISQPEQHSFQAEIQQLLSIVIHSLYTDREVFVRELVSNAADACEKLRFLQASGQSPTGDSGPSITITANEAESTLTIADTGIGMNRDELVQNLGTIAHSGTKAFLKALAEQQKPDTRLIGQFGVGFYSAFMVAKQVTVVTRSQAAGSEGWKWTSEGGNGYTLESAPDAAPGTQITLSLKDEAKEFAQAGNLERIVKRYSNFVAFPLELDGKRVNTVQAIWARSKNEVKEEEYKEFYEYLAHDNEAPKYRLHFTADAPIAIQALLFVPSRSLEMPGMVRQESEVHLYCRKVLIESKPKGLLPEWLRFVRGVVDSEDLPLNVSRERMQDSDLMRKLSKALTNRFLKHLAEEAEKDAAAYDGFYSEYHRFLKEGVLSDWENQAALAKLVRYESSATEAGKKTSMADYVKRMPEGQKDIYYLLAKDRAAAEASPYFEVFRARKFEVLFVDDPIDEFVMDRLREFDSKSITAAEKAELDVEDASKEGALSDDEATSLAGWLKLTLGEAVHEVRSSKRLVDSPVVALDSDKYMTASMRRTLKSMGRDAMAGEDAAPDLEINPRHPVIVKLNQLRQNDAALAGLVAEQLNDQARLASGRLEDPRAMLQRMNALLAKVVDA
ncbi:MAG: molecular chaperone HtpG [Verrucomicrobia bacterium]|nr:molecular chaperone HtpG [Verrucomicrobiota bacterium]